MEHKQKEIEESKKNSLKDAASVNATVGFGDNYISAYLIALNASPTQIGLLTSIPNLIAPLAQLPTSNFMEKHSRKKIFSISTLLQSLIWLPIILISFLFLKNIIYAPWLLIIFYTVYALFGNFASPAWVSWMGDLVHQKESGKFFALRNKIGGITALISMVLGGIILDVFKTQAGTSNKIYFLFIGFSIIFFLAMIFRLISRHFVLKQYEPHFKFEKTQYFSLFQFVKKIPKSNFGKFSLYIALIVLTTNIAGPYYSIYMLKDMGLSYIQFMLMTVASTIAAFVFMSKWGKFSDKFGNIELLRVTSLMIPLVCFLWPIGVYFIPEAYRFYFLIFANLLSGFSWAGFNLAAGNFVYDATTPQRRGLCSAYSTVLNGIGVVIGATIGSIIISHLNINFMNIIMFVSLVSGVLRFGIHFLMFKFIKEVREVESPSWKTIPIASEIYNMHSFIKKGLSFRTKEKKTESSANVPHLPKKIS